MSRGLVAIAGVVMVLIVWTAFQSPVRLAIGGVEVLRNSSIVRPMLIAAILVGLSGNVRILTKGLAIAGAAITLPLGAYVVTFHRMSHEQYPLRALRDCALRTPDTRHEAHAYVSTYYRLFDHAPYYYLRQVGPWIHHQGRARNDDLDLLFYRPGQQAFVIMPIDDYRIFEEQLIRREHIDAVRPAPIDDFGDCGHFTAIAIRGWWAITFDFRYNKRLTRRHLEVAEQFLASARRELRQRSIAFAVAPFVDTLFSAAELGARAHLLGIPDRDFTKKGTHKSIQIRFNRWANAAISSPHRDVLNALSGLRDRVRYLRSPMTLDKRKAHKMLRTVADLIADAKRWIG